MEIFAKFPFEGGGSWNTLCRTISLALRYGVPLSEVIKQLDKLQKTGSSKKKTSPPPKADGDLEKMINERRQQLKSEKGLQCPKCGEAVVKGAQFCSHCGEAQ